MRLALLALALAFPAAAAEPGAAPAVSEPAAAPLSDEAIRKALRELANPGPAEDWRPRLGRRVERDYYEAAFSRPHRRWELGAGIGKTSRWQDGGRLDRNWSAYGFARLELGRPSRPAAPLILPIVRVASIETGDSLPPRVRITERQEQPPKPLPPLNLPR